MKKELESKPPVKVRDSTFDILRAIGLLAIILAHVSPPPIINQIRNFDVPLMVFVSAAVYPSTINYLPSYFSYLKKRIIRLVLPTWIFLIFFFLFFFLLSLLKLHTFPFSTYEIYNTFLLNKGIGFVWVIRVFILVAMLMPFLSYSLSKIKINTLFLSLTYGVYTSYEIIYYYFTQYHVIDKIYVANFLFQNFIYFAIPYGFVAAIGLYVKSSSKKHILALMYNFGILTIALFFLNKFGPTEEAKYPPTIYYLSYALLVSISLYYLLTFEKIKKFFENKVLLFIGRNSLWIYLWHILFIFLWKNYHQILPKNLDNFIIEYVIAVTGGLTITYLQITYMKKLMLLIYQPKFKNILENAFIK